MKNTEYFEQQTEEIRKSIISHPELKPEFQKEFLAQLEFVYQWSLLILQMKEENCAQLVKLVEKRDQEVLGWSNRERKDFEQEFAIISPVVGMSFTSYYFILDQFKQLESMLQDELNKSRQPERKLNQNNLFSQQAEQQLMPPPSFRTKKPRLSSKTG